MNLIDCLLMLVLNTAICLCLPKVLTLFPSNSTRSSWGFGGAGDNLTAPTSRPEFSEPTSYS
ncbi:MAG TPA: hypothetical protein V6D14_17165 [Coleofasciculaceae cyanobacterium]|jgi:hypothetical protein